MFVNKKGVVNKELTILCILKKNAMNFPECNPVQEQSYLLSKSRIFYGSTKSCDISDLRHIQKAASNPTINVRLDGITEHDIRIHVPDKFHVLQDKHTIDNWIRAMPCNLNFMVHTPQFHQIVNAFTIRTANMDFVTVRNQPFHQFQAEIVYHYIVIDQKKNGLLLHRYFSVLSIASCRLNFW